MQMLLIRYGSILVLLVVWALAVKLLPEALSSDTFLRGIFRNLTLVLPMIGLITKVSLSTMGFNSKSWLFLFTGWLISLLVCTSPLVSEGPISIARWSNFVFISPFIEEVVFRGLILQILLGLLTQTKAIVLSSVLFSLMHLPQFLIFDYQPIDIIEGLAFILGLGVILALLTTRFNRLWPAILVHTANNVYGFI